MKPTLKNITNLWFSAETPIRQYKIKMNPQLWAACLKVNRNFTPPSGRTQPEQFRKSDKVAFAKAVLAELPQELSLIEENVYDMA